MNISATPFFPSIATTTQSTNFVEKQLLSNVLKTNHQLVTAQTILQEWNTTSTLSSLSRDWSICHVTRPTARSEFSLLLYNISSLRLHFEDLIEYISESYPDIWALTGLHFNDDVNYRLASYFKSRYTIYYQEGSNSFGGVCLAIAREVTHRIAPDFKAIHNLIAVDVFNSNRRYTVAVIYSPPVEKMPVALLDRLQRYNRNLILVGDLNARHPDWHDVTINSCGRQLALWLEKHPDLTIFNPSQPTSMRSQAIIDLIIAPSCVSSDLAVIDQKMRMSDHYPVHWRLSSFASTSLTLCEVKRVDWDVVNCILDLKQNFFFLLAAQMKHDSVEFIRVYETFLVALQERCTTYSRIKSYRPSLPPYLVNIIKERRRILCLYRWTRSEEHRASLRSLNKYIHDEMRAVKRVQWQEFCLGLEPKNTRHFWNHSKRLFKARQYRIQGFLDERNNQVITDAEAMIIHAQHYYAKSFREADTQYQHYEVSEFKENLTEKIAELPSKPFWFTINDLRRSIQRLKTKTSSGPERVSNKLIKAIPASHYCFLLQTFNALLVTNKYPSHWKMSKMILLPKDKSAILSVTQTRPISLLSCLGKVYERCFLIHLLQWMTDNAILPAEQSGFRAHHSTTTRFVQFLQHLSAGLQQQTASLVIYIDFTKAFDQLWHDGLIYKLHRMNCPRELVVFIIEYLRDRKSYLELNQVTSNIFDIEKGVPQGSCLGPILFLLFHCELAQCIPSATHSHIYADDLALIIHASPWWHRSEFTSQMQRLGQAALNEVHRYAVTWKQPINVSKTEWQWIHRRVVTPTLSLKISNNPIQRTPVFKYLGYYVDERLSFSTHCTKMLQKARKNSVILKFINRSKTSSAQARRLISQAFIQPYLQLIYVVWPLLSNSSIVQVEATNRQLSRLIHNWFDASNDEVRWLPYYHTAESKAQIFLRRFIDKAARIAFELFDDYILNKAMPMYLRMHVQERTFIDTLPKGRFCRHVNDWMNPSTDERRKCYLDRLSTLLSLQP
jgi:hypothetical protein